MGYQEVLKLPLKTFWALNRQLDRLRAEEEQRLLRVLSSAQSAESATQLQQELRQQIGEPVEHEKVFDATRFEELKQRFKGMK
jgi:Na+/phosphate symporter